MPTKTTVTYVDGHAVAVTSEQVPPSKITPDLYMPEDERMRIIAEEQAAEDARSEG